jgi:hypothetical protein
MIAIDQELANLTRSHQKPFTIVAVRFLSMRCRDRLDRLNWGQFIPSDRDCVMHSADCISASPASLQTRWLL